MNTDLVARIQVPLHDNKAIIGTAYPLTKNVVITARHLVDSEQRDKTQPIKIIWQDDKDPSNSQKNRVVSVQQTDIINMFTELGVVIINCDLPKELAITALYHFSDTAPGHSQDWQSVGFPVIANDQDNNSWEKHSTSGKIEPVIKGSPYLQLNCPSDMIEKQYWQGISGAPVFSDRIFIGVLIETPHKVANRLQAISMHHLLQEPEFKKLIALDDPIDNFKPAIETLEASKVATAALLEKLPGIIFAQSPKAIINHLKTIPYTDLIRLIYEVQQQRRADKDLYQSLRELLRQMLPALFNPALAAILRRSKTAGGECVIQIPYATELSAELLMAAVDMRPADWQLKVINTAFPDRKELIPSQFKLPYPPECGRSQEQLHKDTLGDLTNRLTPTVEMTGVTFDAEAYLFSAFVNLKEDDVVERRRLVNGALEFDAEFHKPGYYWLWLTANDERDEKFAQFAEHIKTHYPLIILLNIDKKFDRVAEMKSFSALPLTQEVD